MTLSPRKIYRCVISLGSNLEPRLLALRKALDLWAKQDDITCIAVGWVYETVPEPKPGFTFDTDFLNTCLALDTSLSAHDLISICKKIEKICGRDFEKELQLQAGDRVIDCDLIFHGDESVHDDTLIVPHPKWHTRNFVVLPLYDIRDHLTVLQKEKVARALDNLDPRDIIAPSSKLELT